jgi:putative ATPase
MEREPLASRIRPATLSEFIGQEHLVGAGKPLRVAIQKKELFSFILWGPPGCGKTTLARIYAHAIGADFFELSAVDSGKEDIRKLIPGGKAATLRPRVLFLDEIHRFNKAQQDFLLPFVEKGALTLIGATTENPSFEVIAPLLSRCRVFVLKELTTEEMARVLARTKLKIPKDAREWLATLAAGDARQALTVLETAEKLYGTITIDTLKEAVQSTHLRYDKKGEEHYNTMRKIDSRFRVAHGLACAKYCICNDKCGGLCEPDIFACKYHHTPRDKERIFACFYHAS